MLWAAAVKWRVRPAPPAELHEVHGSKAAMRGSRRLAHTDYCKCGPACVTVLAGSGNRALHFSGRFITSRCCMPWHRKCSLCSAMLTRPVSRSFLDRAATRRPDLPLQKADRWLYTVTQARDIMSSSTGSA